MGLWPTKNERLWRRVARRLKRVARDRGVMRRPEVDWETHRLVEGPLELDMLNVFHSSRQLEGEWTHEVLEAWIAPKDLGQAGGYGRVDEVRRMLAEGASPDALPPGDHGPRHPLSAITSAWVVTPLHVECVRALCEAGTRLYPSSFRLDPDAVGRAPDFALLDVLVEYGLQSDDPAVREAAANANVAGMRLLFDARRSMADAAREKDP